MNLNGPRKLLIACYALGVITLCVFYVPLRAFTFAVHSGTLHAVQDQYRAPQLDEWGPLWSTSRYPVYVDGYERTLFFTPDVAKLVIFLFALSVFAGFGFMLIESLDISKLASLRRFWRVPNWFRKRRRQILWSILVIATIVAGSFGILHLQREARAKHLDVERNQRGEQAAQLLDSLSIAHRPQLNHSDFPAARDSMKAFSSHRRFDMEGYLRRLPARLQAKKKSRDSIIECARADPAVVDSLRHELQKLLSSPIEQ